MPYKVFTTEEVLASADVQNYLMKQVVVTCTSGTRPASPSEGMTCYETDTDRYMGYDGSGWREVAVLNPPSACAQRTSDQSISSAVQTTVSFAQAAWNIRNMWTAGNPSRLTVPSGMGGVYEVGGVIEYEANINGARQAILLLNGAPIGRSSSMNSGSGPPGRMSFHRMINVSAGDYFELAGYQNSGVTLQMTNANRQPELWARRVGPTS